jgi:hypothetical protein
MIAHLSRTPLRAALILAGLFLASLARADSQAPVVVISAPQEGVVLRDTSVHVAFTASDDTGVVSCRARLSDGDWQEAPTVGPAVIAGAGAGDQTVEVSCADAAGNVGGDAVGFSISPPACQQGALRSKSVWTWGTTIAGQVPETIAQLSAHGFTDLFLLVKGSSGSFTFDKLDQAVAARDASGSTLRIHAWIACFRDDSMGGWVSASNAGYRSHLLDEVLAPLLSEHRPDGVLLDYLRAPGTGSPPADVAAITSFANEARAKIDSLRPQALLGAAVMPEGSSNAASYGQDYAQLAGPLDLLLPMTYTYNYSQDADWVQRATRYVVEKAAGRAEVWPVLQASNDQGEAMPGDRLDSEIDAGLLGGGSGISLFRHPLTEEQLTVLDRYEAGQCQGDVVPPELGLTSPQDGARIVGAVELAWRASDDVGVSRMALWTDRAGWTPIASGADSLRIALPAGPRLLELFAFDAAGNGTRARVAVTVADEPLDAGAAEADAGEAEADGGSVTVIDAGGFEDAGEPEETVSTAPEAAGCGCASAGTQLWPALGLLLLALGRTAAARR